MIEKKEDWVSVLILTRNEESHVERCIQSAKKLSSQVIVVDSNSTDHTASIAKKMGAVVISGDFGNLAEKLNWAIENVDFQTPWVFRLDADELMTPSLLTSLANEVDKAASNVSGFYLRRQLWFMGRWMKHGGMYPTYSMRLWKKGIARTETRSLDEHMILTEGVAATLELDIIDNPLINLTSWIDKHNGYASLELNQIIADQIGDEQELIHPRLWGSRVERIRWLKLKLFYRLPMFLRPVIYFLYRYIIRLGFLDGREGFLFHFMHGLWYRILIDGKIMEYKGKDRL